MWAVNLTIPLQIIVIIFYESASLFGFAIPHVNYVQYQFYVCSGTPVPHPENKLLLFAFHVIWCYHYLFTIYLSFVLEKIYLVLEFSVPYPPQRSHHNEAEIQNLILKKQYTINVNFTKLINLIDNSCSRCERQNYVKSFRYFCFFSFFFVQLYLKHFNIQITI